MKKLTAVLLALMLALAMVPTVALADPVYTSVGTAAELTTALGGTSPIYVKLTANIEITGAGYTIEAKTVTIDMNGFNLSFTNTTPITAFKLINGSSFTLKNTAAAQSKLLSGAGCHDEHLYKGIHISGSGYAVVGANVSIETSLPVHILGNGGTDSAKLDVYGKLLVTVPYPGYDSYAAIQGNGTANATNNYGGTLINIFPGAEVLNTLGAAMYIPQAGEVNISGGTITGKSSAIAIKAGKLNITGGTLHATGPATLPTEGWSNGVNASGCAIQIESNSGYAGGIELDITGGTFISDHGYALYEYIGLGTDTKVTKLALTGGTFINSADAAVVGDKLISTELADKTGIINTTGATFLKGTGTELTANVDPTFTIVIPSKVDFGSLQTNTGVKTKTFTVQAKDVALEAGKKVTVTVTVANGFNLMSGTTPLAYKLFNSASSVNALASGDTFASFTATRDEVGSVSVDTAAISAAGAYSGVMVFTIDYVDA